MTPTIPHMPLETVHPTRKNGEKAATIRQNPGLKLLASVLSGTRTNAWRSLRTGALAACLLGLGLVIGAPALAQQATACSSDGLQPPVALMERFTNADCADCWSAAQTPRPPRGAIALDWIVPGAQGDEAPLSAATSRDASQRLHALHHRPPAGAETYTSRAAPAGRLRLRVAHGPAFNGYIGASIELRPPAGIKKPFTSWLALVETIPAGTEGSPVERHLVRNVFQPDWGNADAPTRARQSYTIESRVMNIPEGANPSRLRVIGWIEDADGQVRVIAQSRCAPTH